MNAFGLIYQKFWPSLYNAAYKRLRDKDLCKDVVQNVFTDLWQRRTQVDIKNLAAYLHTAVRFQVYTISVKQPATTELFNALEEILISPFGSDENIINEELRRIVDSWIRALPEKRRKIFILHYYEELSTNDIAVRLNISQKTVQNQLNTATSYIRARFAHFLSVSLILGFIVKP